MNEYPMKHHINLHHVVLLSFLSAFMHHTHSLIELALLACGDGLALSPILKIDQI